MRGPSVLPPFFGQISQFASRETRAVTPSESDSHLSRGFAARVVLQPLAADFSGHPEQAGEGDEYEDCVDHCDILLGLVEHPAEQQTFGDQHDEESKAKLHASVHGVLSFVLLSENQVSREPTHRD
jgi:hypothetical protein